MSCGSGRLCFRLAVEPVDGANALVIRFAPWSGPVFPDWAHAESRVLVPELAGFELRYCEEDASAASCLPAWTVANRLPARVRLSVRDARGAWPDLVVAMRVPGGGAGGSRGGFSLGPE